MFNPNKINNQIIKNHNKKIKDIPDSKFFNVRPRPVIHFASKVLTKLFWCISRLKRCFETFFFVQKRLIGPPI